MKNQVLSKIIGKKFLSSFLVAVCVITMALGSVTTCYASSYTWAAPTTPISVNKNIITAAAHRAAQTAPEILGANIVATSNIGGAHNGVTDGFNDAGEPTTLTGGQTTPMLGIFGSNVNANPDPYYYNYFYNLYADAKGLPKTSDSVLVIPAMQAPNAADTAIIEAYGTSTSLYRRPDILLGDSGNKTYNVLIANLPENKDADTKNDYNPYQVSYNLTTTYQMADDLKAMAADMVEINKATGKTWRYDNPVTIANDYEKYIKGLSAYVCSKIADGTVRKKKIAVIDATSATVNGDGTFKAFLSTTSSGTAANCRGAEYLNECTTNLAAVKNQNYQSTSKDATGKEVKSTSYYLTADQLMTADAIIICGAQTSSSASVESLKNALIKYGTNVTESKIPEIMSTNPDCVYGITMNSAENGIGFGYYIGYVYPEIVNPIYASAYFYEKFLHITDQSKLQSAISANFENASLPSKVTTALTNYNSANVEAMLTEGMNYYETHKTAFVGTALDGWKIDWTAGIGSKNLSQSITNINSAYAVGVDTKVFNLTAKAKGTVTYNSDNTKVVTVNKTSGAVTIIGIGKANITITASATNGYNAAVKKITVTVTPKKTTLKSLSSKSNKMTIAWIQDKGVTGYQVVYSTSNNFKGYKFTTLKGNYYTYKIISNLRKGQTYYVEARSYKTVNGVNYYSAYSTVNKVTIK